MTDNTFNMDDILEGAEKCINDFDLRNASKMANVLTSQLPRVSPDLKVKIQGLITRLRFVALPILYSEQDILGLFKEGFVEALLNEVPDIKQRLKAKLLEYWYDDRDQVRQNIVVALHANQESLTTGPLNSEGGAVIKGTIGNWLNDYDKKLGIELVDNVKIANYLFQDQSTKKLSKEDREILGKLFRFYEWIKLSSQTAAGIEEEIEIIEDGTVKDFNRGLPIELFHNVKGPISRYDNISSSAAPPERKFVSVALTLTGIMKQSGPAFFFDIKDEEEVDKIRQQMASSQWPMAAGLEQRLRVVAEEIIKDYSFSFTDETSKKRFIQLVVSYLKDIRGIVEVREVLQKGVSQGGLGLAPEKGEAVVKILQKIRLGLPDLLKKKEGQVMPAAPVVETKPVPVVKKLSEQDIAKWRQDLMAETVISDLPELAKQEPVKAVLQDVKAPPRTLGPLEEIKEMTLTDFRRLGASAAESVDKILHKLQLISEGGIGRKVQAIRAWQSSPVYRLYVDMGRESIEQGRPVTEVITSHQAQNDDSLTVAEFEAVVDLNQKLRF